MRVIFLDIDGVLSNDLSAGTYWVTRLPRAYEPRETYAVPPFDKKCVRCLNRLIENTEANIVLSSVWGREFQFGPLRQHLLGEGVEGKIISTTPVSQQYRPRGYDIQQWLDEHDGPEVENFVILDDHEDMMHLFHRLVWIDRAIGLQDSHVEAAQALLECY